MQKYLPNTTNSISDVKLIIDIEGRGNIAGYKNAYPIELTLETTPFNKPS